MGGLPAPEGGESFFRACVAAGARAVPVARRNGLWERQAPPASDRRARGIYELRIRLGLFFAGSLRYLVHGLPRLRIDTEAGDWGPLKGSAKAGTVEWNPIRGGAASYEQFVAVLEGGEAAVSWSGSEANFGEICVLLSFFLLDEEKVLLSESVMIEVLNYLQPGRPKGLFGRMLAADGQGKVEAVDVAGVFLEGLVQAVGEKVLRLNTKIGGHLFVTPNFWFLTTPIGVNCVNDFIRGRSVGRRHDLRRHDVFQALREAGHLVGRVDDKDTPRCVVKARRWGNALELRGLCIAAGVLFRRLEVPFFEGNVTLIKDGNDGSDE